MTSTLSRRTSDLAVVEAEDRISVLDLTSLERPPVILEGTAMEIWRLLDGSLDLAGVVTSIAALYEVPEETVAEDVAGFIASLSDLGLVEEGA